MARVPFGKHLALQFNATNIGNVWSQINPFSYLQEPTPPGIPGPQANSSPLISPGGIIGPPELCDHAANQTLRHA